MKICIIAEGCYPYVVGGVSGWINNLINSFPEHEFIMLSVISNREISGKFKYELPSNLTEVYEVYLNDNDYVKKVKKNHTQKIPSKYVEALESLLFGENPV